MQLKLIKDEVCPNCQSDVVAESCRNHHVNGQGFEERTFRCGCILSWSPNFNRLQVKRGCPESPKEIEKKKAERNLLNQIKDLIQKSNVDDDFKRNLMLSIPIY